MKRFNWFAVFAMLTLGVVLDGHAAPPPDNATDEAAKINDRIFASLDDVDDVGYVVLWNGNGARTVASCEWQNGQHGSDTVKLDSKLLTKGQNYLIFVLYNKKYVGTGVFSGGKWSGNLKLTKNRETVWEVKKYKRENTIGIKYWKIISLFSKADGSVAINTEKMPADLTKQLTKHIDKLEDKLNENLDVATPF